MKKAWIINIGDELLAGRTVNTNAAYLGRKLFETMVEPIGVSTIPDKLEVIKEHIEEALEEADIVLMTGGLGPTHDDVTKQAIAEHLNREFYFDEETFENIKDLFAGRGIEVKPAHKEQSYMPKGCELFTNRMGTAPGMWFDLGEKHLISLPGVPYELEYLMEHGILDKINALSPETGYEEVVLRTAGVPESVLAELLEENIASLPEEASLAFLPSPGEVKVRLTVRTATAEQAKKLMGEIEPEIAQKLAPWLYAKGHEGLKETLGSLFEESGKTLATAESCTGGKLAHTIVSVPGASKYYWGSTVTYQNELKEKWLGVDPEVLKNKGAVSEETVKAMVEGVLKWSGADIAISISGIAGPTGGTPEKPVGTIWVAWGDNNQVKTRKLQLWDQRKKNIDYTVSFCLNALIKFLKQYYLS